MWWLLTFFLIFLSLICLFKLLEKNNTNSARNHSNLSIAFVHLDLGIGGAEKLVVEAAVGLKRKGHTVKIYTSFHDKNHSFPETNDGTLEVIVAGNWLPIHTQGLFQLPKALIRFLVVSIEVLLENHRKPFNVLIVDQISSTIPVLKLSGAKVIYYCHFPDQLLAKRNNLLKKIYRYPFDRLEEYTTSKSDLTLVNSKFTLKIFHDTFKSITKSPKIVYPCVNIETNLKEIIKDKYDQPHSTILSLNRYERKKKY